MYRFNTFYSFAKSLILPEQAPALSLGLFFYLGVLVYFKRYEAAFFALACFCFTSPKKFVINFIAFLLPWIYLHQIFTFPPSGTPFTGRFHIQALHKSEKFKEGWIYKGFLHIPQGKLSVSFFSLSYYPADRDYSLSGTLESRDEGLHFQIKKPLMGAPCSYTFSLADLRYRAKDFISRYIQDKIKISQTANFLKGIVLGELNDAALIKNFRRVGLSHILAISGFHFGLLAFFFHLFLRFLLPSKFEAWVLIGILTFYFLLIGDSPSVQRAWILAMIWLGGKIIKRESCVLNSLGIAILVSLLLNPLTALSLSFQLSFLATGALLLLLKPMDQLLQLWIPQHTFQTLLQRPLWAQYSYIGCQYLRQTLSLTLTVHLATLPLLIQLFHTLSFNTLFYNLFFPLLLSLSLFLFYAALFFPPLHTLNTVYSTWVLRGIESPPCLFQTYVMPDIGPWLLPIWLGILWSLSIYFQRRKTEDLIV